MEKDPLDFVRRESLAQVTPMMQQRPYTVRERRAVPLSNTGGNRVVKEEYDLSDDDDIDER